MTSLTLEIIGRYVSIPIPRYAAVYAMTITPKDPKSEDSDVVVDIVLLTRGANQKSNSEVFEEARKAAPELDWKYATSDTFELVGPGDPRGSMPYNYNLEVDPRGRYVVHTDWDLMSIISPGVLSEAKMAPNLK